MPKTQLTKALSLLLVILMIAAASPAALFDGALTLTASVAKSGKCGDNLTWTLDDEGTLTISGAGEMEDYLSFSNVPWYSSRENIKSVVIKNSVTSIGKYAINQCTGLTSVTRNGMTENFFLFLLDKQ